MNGSDGYSDGDGYTYKMYNNNNKQIKSYWTKICTNILYNINNNMNNIYMDNNDTNNGIIVWI